MVRPSAARGFQRAVRRLSHVVAVAVLAASVLSPIAPDAAAAARLAGGAPDPGAGTSGAVAPGPSVGGLTVTSASADASDPHGFLDDSSTGPVPTGPHPAATGTPTLAAGFTSSVIFSGLSNPTAVRFASDGSVWVIQKSGKVLRYSSPVATTPTVFADLSGEVNSYWDRGLMGLALSPTFPADPSVYVLYTYDHNPVSDYMPSAPTQWNDNCVNPPGSLTDGCPILGRLSKLTANAGGATWSGAENVLVQGWCQQGPSHAMDNLAFGPDGYLYASAGEGDMFNVADYGQVGGTTNPIVTPANPCGDPPGGAGTALTAPTAEGGMLRSQSPLRTDGPAVLSGTLLRVDPNTGAGAPGNPFASSSDANAKKILAYGLRNPFRFTFRPGFSNQVWLGDVGNATWEEIDKIPVPTGGGSIPATGNDFGWPCYEGNVAGITYGVLQFNQCTSLVNSGNAMGPFYEYNHAAHINAGESCRTGSSSISALAFYTGTQYPVAYRGALFFGDHSRDCIWAMLPDGSGNPDPTNVVPVVTGSPAASTYWLGIVDLEAGPNGDLFYVDLDSGTINRISYGLPSALIQSDLTSGPSPLTVHLDGAHSSDPAGGGLTYTWTVPGGSCDSLTSATPTCTFPLGTWGVTLTVTDINNAQDTSVPYTITGGDAPPVPVIDAIDDAPPPTQPGGPLPPPPIRPNGVPAFWSVGDNITFSGHATDLQDGTEPAANLSWQLVMHHCPSDCHLHFLQTWDGTTSGSVAAPDHDYPSYLELILTATDAQGLSASTSVYLYPKTATLHIGSSPVGVALTVGNGNTVTTPHDVTFIDGGAASLSAAPGLSVDGTPYKFDSWSDGGAISHTVTARDGDTYTANYVVGAETYHPVTPVRLLDTRIGNGLSGKLVAGIPATFQVTGRGGSSNIPIGAAAITANVTVVHAGTAASVYLGPDPLPHPTTATVNVNGSDIKAAGSIVSLGGAGTVSATYMAGSGTTDLLMDVTGYFTSDTTGDTYHPLAPVRLLDTRHANGLSGKFVAGVPRSFLVWGRGGVPHNATAVTGNLTVTNASNPWAVYLGPDKIAKSTTSTVNFAARQTRANSVTVPLSSSGTLAATFLSKPKSKTDLVFDVTGYYTADLLGALWVPLTPPVALLDTRNGTGLSGRFVANSPRTFAVWGSGGIPSNATAVTGIVSVYNQSNSWAVFVGPLPTPKPSTSTLNFVRGDNTSNSMAVALSPSGGLSVTYMAGAGNTTNVEFVVTGYFVP